MEDQFVEEQHVLPIIFQPTGAENQFHKHQMIKTCQYMQVQDLCSCV